MGAKARREQGEASDRPSERAAGREMILPKRSSFTSLSPDGAPADSIQQLEKSGWGQDSDAVKTEFCQESPEPEPSRYRKQ